MATPRRSRNEKAADRLHSAAIHLLRSLRKVDEASGLTAPRLSVLSVLVFGGPKTLGELATAEQVRPPTMTRLVTALERDGYVKRKADSADGRRTVIHATKKGTGVMAMGRSRRVAELAARLGQLPDDDIELCERAAMLMSRVTGLAGVKDR
ncbi:MAG TPA: MarR family transcriptional regulator [Gemmatimonadaceae bacterium]|nr:MarR family transcriptional regulator [Gemmatimonadaceae bacterium]